VGGQQCLGRKFQDTSQQIQEGVDYTREMGNGTRLTVARGRTAGAPEGKCKAIPCNRLWRPIGLWDVEASTFVSLTRRQHFTPRKNPGTRFCWPTETVGLNNSIGRDRNPVTDNPVVLSNNCVYRYFITIMSQQVADKKIHYSIALNFEVTAAMPVYY
jgi:hypothetical protein